LKQELTLVTWNLNATDSRPVARSRLIFDHIVAGTESPDIIFFQEATSPARKDLLNNARVRSGFLVSDAEDETSFNAKNMATMTLLSRKRFACGPDPQLVEGTGKLTAKGIFRMALPSDYEKDALCVDVVDPSLPGTFLRFFNVHLDPFNAVHLHAQQMEMLASLLRKPGCGVGAIAGDFNAVARGPCARRETRSGRRVDCTARGRWGPKEIRGELACNYRPD
jgi:tyrosyl-DNA phosphodiesterase 2